MNLKSSLRIKRFFLNPYFIFILCVSIFATVIVSKKTRPDTLTIVHITDTHICNLTSYHPLFVKSREHYGNGVKPLKKFLTTIPKVVSADMVVITGDNIDFYEAETNNGKIMGGQIEQFSQLYDLCPVPLFMVLGDHDIGSYWIDLEEKKHFSQTNVQKAKVAWIRNISCFQNGTYYSRIYKVGKRKYRFIFLDNSYYLNSKHAGDLLDKPQLDWLNDQLNKAHNESIILFMHRSIPVGDTNKDGVHFPTPPDGWPFEDTYEHGLMKILNKTPSIIAAFVGHNHRNIIEDIPFPTGHRITQIETAAFGRNPNNWRIIEVMENNLLIYSTGSRDIEMKIHLKEGKI